MKLKTQFTRANLKADNHKVLLANRDKPQFQAITFHLVNLLAQVADESIAEGTYITMGVTRDKTALLLTVKRDEGNLYFSGSNLFDLAARIGEAVD